MRQTGLTVPRSFVWCALFNHFERKEEYVDVSKTFEYVFKMLGISIVSFPDDFVDNQANCLWGYKVNQISWLSL